MCCLNIRRCRKTLPSIESVESVLGVELDLHMFSLMIS